MLKLGRVTKVNVFFLVLVYVLILANFNLHVFEFSAAILEKGLLNPWPPVHRAVGLFTELLELLESNVILVFRRPWSGSIPVGDSAFFFVRHSCHVDYFTFHISSSKFTIFIYLSRMMLFVCFKEIERIQWHIMCIALANSPVGSIISRRVGNEPALPPRSSSRGR